MKSTVILLLAWITIAHQTLSAQVFSGTPADYRNHQILDQIKTYEIFAIPIVEINTYVHDTHRNNSGVPLQLKIGSRLLEWTIYENQLLSPQVIGSTMYDHEYHAINFDKACRTFIGYPSDHQKSSRLTITANNFSLMMPEAQAYLMIEPLHHYIPSANKELVVVYKSSDIKYNDAISCGSMPGINKNIPAKEKNDYSNSSAKGVNRTFSCRELQVTFATDNQMWQEYEDVDLLLDFNLTVLNFVEHFYDDFDLDFRVHEFYMVTDPANSANPWGDETDIGELIDDFGNWAEDYFDIQDIGHLWSAADLYNDDGSGVLGRAYLGGACNDINIYPWAIQERFSATDFYTLALLQAHEYGHLLDADHAPGTGTIMEPSIDLVESASWHDLNIEEMLDFMEDESCIQSCIACPLSYDIIDYISWGDWKYSSLLNVNSTAVIAGEADVIFQSEGFVKLTPGFSATSLLDPADGGTFVAKIAPCE